MFLATDSLCIALKLVGHSAVSKGEGVGRVEREHGLRGCHPCEEFDLSLAGLQKPTAPVVIGGA